MSLIADYAERNELTLSQREVFAEVITSSLRITQRQHLFSWLQGSFQILLGHEIMVCAVRASDTETYYFDNFSSTRYFTNDHLHQATQADTGLISRVMAAWKHCAKPIMVAPNLQEGDFGNYLVPFVEDEFNMRRAELINIVAHGMRDNQGNLAAFFSFSRVGKPVNSTHAYMLELLMPHLHCAVNRVMGKHESQAKMPTKVASVITGREIEILKWVQLGKTNWEIASILAISPLTVKNHIQNILRKLDVQNRSQAASKAIKLGLVKI